MTSDLNLLCRSLFLKPKDLILAIVAYFDETGDTCDLGRNIFGFGGFIGRVEDWEIFDTRWRAACPPEFFPFHMKDFVKATARDDATQRKVIAPLMEVIQTSNIVPVSVVFDMREFRRVCDAAGLEPTAKQGEGIYHAVLAHLFAKVSFIMTAAQSLDGDNPMPVVPHMVVVFAQRRCAGKVYDWWWEHREKGTGPICALLSGVFLKGVSISTPEAATPLQAADFLSWEVGHHYEVMADKGKKRWPMRQFESLPAVEGVGSPLISFVSLMELTGDWITVGDTMIV